MVVRHLTAEGQWLGSEPKQVVASQGTSASIACDDGDCLVTYGSPEGGELRAVRLADNTRSLPFRLAPRTAAQDIVQAGDKRLAVASSADGVYAYLFAESNEPKRSLLS